MEAKEKAKELVDKFYSEAEDHPVLCGTYCMGGSIDRSSLAKRCALIVVDEILNLTRVGRKYWQEVKKEIEKS